jgi:hypothetical protein
LKTKAERRYAKLLEINHNGINESKSIGSPRDPSYGDKISLNKSMNIIHPNTSLTTPKAMTNTDAVGCMSLMGNSEKSTE